MTVEEQLAKFEPEFVKGMIESLICYMKSCGCTSYEVSSLCGWSIRMKEKAK